MVQLLVFSQVIDDEVVNCYLRFEMLRLVGKVNKGVVFSLEVVYILVNNFIIHFALIVFVVCDQVSALLH